MKCIIILAVMIVCTYGAAINFGGGYGLANLGHHLGFADDYTGYGQGYGKGYGHGYGHGYGNGYGRGGYNGYGLFNGGYGYGGYGGLW